MPDQANPPRTVTGELRQQIVALNRLVEVSRIMTSTLKLGPLLQFIMEAAAEICGAEAASLLLVDKNTNELRFAAALEEAAQKLVGMVVPMEGSIAGSIVAEDRALVIDDVADDPRHYDGVDEQIAFQTRSILGVPLRMADQLVGVLEVLNKREGPFSAEDIYYIEILAAQAAVAIERTRLLNSLEEAYEDLNQLDKLKTDFISLASHELRTPLSVILGYATFLQEDAPADFREHTAALMASALQMRGLIEGMTNLRYVQLEDGEMDIAAVDVEELLAAAFDEMLPLAGARQQVFVYEMDPLAEPVFVRADRDKVRLALGGVLHNAVKFTPPGGAIILSGEVKPAKDEFWITVRDNGFGIPADRLEKIFEQFYQVEDVLVREHGGMGLGLAIARAIVEKVGGRIWAESPGVGEGSRFTIALKLASADERSRLKPLS